MFILKLRGKEHASFSGINRKVKKLDKAILVLFSVVVFIESVLLIFVIEGWLDFVSVSKIVSNIIIGENTSKVLLVTSCICMVLAVKCIFYGKSDKEKAVKGILMQNDNGKLLISKQTVENIVVSTINGFDSVEDINVQIELDNLNNVIVNVNLVVNKNVVIKELTLNMQNKIKEAIKKTSDLEVKEVNVKIKNINIEESEKK